MHLKNAEENSNYYINPSWHEGRKPGVSAFLRVRNEEEFIAACLYSIYPFFDEILVALNNCTDKTPEIVRSLHLPNIKVYDYPFKLHHNGPGHNAIPEHSLYDNSYYYNWLLAKTSYSHACKWDGDMIALSSLLSPTFKKNVLESNVLFITGVNISGESMSHISSGAPFSTEPRFFKVEKHTYYRQGELTQHLTHNHESKIIREQIPAFLHFKNVKNTDSATMIWPNNWRDIPHFQRLWERRKEAELYRGEYPDSLLDKIIERALVYAIKVDNPKSQERVMRNLGKILFELRKIGMKGPVVEIGSFKGKLTVFLSRICETLHPDSEVVSVDPYTENGAQLALSINPSEIGKVYADFLKSTENLTNHRHLRLKSQESAAEIPEDIMLSFIDGEHTYKGVIHDFAMIYGKTQRGGVIALDDYKNMAWPEVVKAFAHICKQYREKIRLIHEDGKAAYFQKLQA
jgi:hypothetical protein